MITNKELIEFFKKNASAFGDELIFREKADFGVREKADFGETNVEYRVFYGRKFDVIIQEKRTSLKEKRYPKK
jgi:hypothetical protein